MILTLGEALKLEPLRSVQVLAGASGLDREVGFVTVMDAPDLGNWLRGKELVITTAFSIKDDPSALTRIIRELAEHNSAGIGLKLRRYLDRVAPEALAEADRLGVPVLALPYELAWIDIINPVLSEILHRQAARLERSEQIHRNFIRNVLEGGGLNAVALTLAGLTGRPVVIVDPACSPLGVACPREDLSDLWRRLVEFLSSGQAPGFAPEPAEPAEASRLHSTSFPVDGVTLPLLVLPVTVQTDLFGYVGLWGGGEAPAGVDILALEHAATVTALEMLKLRATREVERRFRSQFIYDLLAGNFESERVLLDRARALGWEMDRPFGLLLLDIDRFERFVAGKQEREIQALKETVLREVSAVTASRFPGAICSDRSDSVVVLIPWARDSEPRAAKETLREHARLIQATLQAHLKSLSVSVGLGSVRSRALDLPQSYAEARRALSLGRELYGSGAVVHVDDFGIYRFLTRGADQADLLGFVEETLGPLIAYDRRRGSRLVQTLRAYLDASRNLRRAAAALFIHENTLKHRLQRIRELSGLDLENAEVCLNVQVALRIHQLSRR